ncbi:MAG: DUF3798 domain-containing protein, partial [Clostridiales bacterium]|nr:DUF3798 domain-containing protein [Clostridiales bacterium]
MTKIFRAFIAITALMLVLVIIAGCHKLDPMENSPKKDPSGTSASVDDYLDNSPTEDSTSQLVPTDYHIGIVTKGFDFAEDELRGVEELVAKYDTVQNGGKIQWYIYPMNLATNREAFVSMIAELADDPLMKAVIVPTYIQGTAAGFQKIKDTGRDDILLLTNMPQDDPEVIKNVATIIVNEDHVLRGYYDIVRTKNMGATTFVHMSFPRHMSTDVLARRKAIYEEACKDLGLKFVFETVPDPAAGDL